MHRSPSRTSTSRRDDQRQALLCAPGPLQSDPITSMPPQPHRAAIQRNAACLQTDEKVVNRTGLEVAGYFE
ncbi:hypothetical protein KIN20_029699 [Parelaphostrongylus tenuis]|nr:hypothetical protein KIN20_029699 [Parelaphostrongylus tenuis]